MADPTARHLVNRAQVEQASQAEDAARRRTPAIPRIGHSMGFVDLIGSCAAFVGAISRALPRLRNRRFADEGLHLIHENLDRVRTAADLCQSVVDSGGTSIDERLARLLRGE